METTVPRDDDNGFDRLKEKILFLLDLYGKQLEVLQKDTADAKMALVSLKGDIAALRDEQNKKTKTASHFLGEALKVVSAIITAYLLFKFGLI